MADAKAAPGLSERAPSQGGATWIGRALRKALDRFSKKEDRIDPERQIHELESKALQSQSGHLAHHLNRAGDLALSLGDVDRALRYWGWAIDAYLSFRPEAAAAACRKVLRHAPGVVRAHRTLTLLSIGFGRLDEAMAHLRDYVTVARRSEHEDLAVQQLRRMARIAKDERFTRRVAELLAELGDLRGSTALAAEADTLRGIDPVNPPDRWDAVIRAAQMSAVGASVAERLQENENWV